MWFRNISVITKNQMENRLEHEMEAATIWEVIGLGAR